MLEKYIFSLKWNLKSFLSSYSEFAGNEFGGYIKTLKEVLLALFSILTIPVSIVCIVLYPLYHLVYYPILAMFKMEDGLIEKLEKLGKKQTMKSAGDKYR